MEREKRGTLRESEKEIKALRDKNQESHSEIDIGKDR